MLRGKTIIKSLTTKIDYWTLMFTLPALLDVAHGFGELVVLKAL